MTYDFLALGDTTMDAFIRLKDARVTCDMNDVNCMLCVRYGDKIPYEFVEVIPAVGNSANAAVAAARLGLSAALRAHVGDDENGATCIASLEKDGVDTSLVVREAGKKTNYHYVLWYDVERTILIKHEEYAYGLPKDLEPPRWLYLSSMAHGTEEYHKEIGRFAVAHPEMKIAFQPGTFQLKLGVETLRDVYARTEIFFCNKEEAKLLLKSDSDDMRALLESVRALGPKIAIITDGRKGSYGLDEKGAWRSPMYPDPKPPVERTGAGDATASTCVAFIALGLDPREALLRGLINSANVVQEIGAQRGLMTKERIEEWYAKRPTDFVASPL